MTELRFEIDIEEPKERVWEVMLSPQTYPKWTAAFMEGSDFQGSWDQDAEIRFVAVNKDGKDEGILAHIAENIPYQFISIEVTGLIMDGEVDTESEEAQKWIGGHENYSFSENGDVTTLTIELKDSELSPEMAEEFKRSWPLALAKLKQLCEDMSV